MALQVFGTPATRRNKAKEFQDIVSAGIGGASKVIQGNIASRQQKEDDEAIKEAYGIDLSHFKDPKERLVALTSELATKGKEKLLAQKQENTRSALGRLGLGEEPLSQGQPQERPSLVGEPQGMPEIGGEQSGLSEQTSAAQKPLQQKRSAADIPDAEIAQLSSVDPQLGNLIQKMKDTAIREKQEEKKEELRRLEKKEDRAFREKILTRSEDTAQSKPILIEADQALKNIPIQEQAIEDIREASSEVGMRDYIADKFGFEPLRTAEGAKLKTAVKDFFLSDLTRAGGRPNQFLEQQLADALPKVGREPIANLITAEGMKFKVDLAKERVRLIQELAEQDREKIGWVRGDIASRADKKMKSYVEKRQRQLVNDVKDIKSGKKKFEKTDSKMVDVIGPDGQEYEIHMSEVELLPEGYLLK